MHASELTLALLFTVALTTLLAAPAQAIHDVEEPDRVFVCLGPDGDADCETLAAGRDDATGDVAVAATGNASGSLAVAPTGDAWGHNAGLSGTGDAEGILAASGTGSCNAADADPLLSCVDASVPQR